MVSEPDLDAAPIGGESRRVSGDGRRTGQSRKTGSQILTPGGHPFILKSPAAESESGEDGGGGWCGKGREFLRREHFTPAAFEAIRIGPLGQRNIKTQLAEIILHKRL